MPLRQGVDNQPLVRYPSALPAMKRKFVVWVERRLQDTADPFASSQSFTHHKTSPARDADTLRLTLCNDQNMGDMTADPGW